MFMLIAAMSFATNVYAAKDKTKPTIKYELTPDKDSYSVGEKVTVSFDFADKVELGKYQIDIDGVKKVATDIPAGKTEYSVNITTDPLKEDTKVSCTLYDAAGNKATKSVTLECRDTTTPPKVSLTLPDGDNFDVGDKAAVKVNITDETKLKKYEITHNGDTKSYSTTSKSVSKEYKYTVASGLNIVKVVAWDTDGNTATGTITFSGTADAERPVINALRLNPNESMYEEGDSIKLKIECTDNRAVDKIEIRNGNDKDEYKNINSANVSKEYSIKTIAGTPTKVSVYVYDKAGNVTSKELYYNCKKPEKAPEIKSASLDDTKYEEGETIRINYSFTDDTSLSSFTIKHDGVVVKTGAISGTEYSGNWTVNALGKKAEIVITVKDASGKEKSKTLKYTGGPIDADPVITQVELSPEEYEYSEGDKITVVIKATDETKLSKYVIYHNGEEEKKGSLSGKSDTAKPYITAIPGKNVEVKVVVYDGTGNYDEKYLHYNCVEVDNYPEIKSVSREPSKSIYRVGETVTVSAKLSDDKGLASYKVYSSGSYSAITSGNCYGDKTKNINFNVKVHDGDNEIEIYVYDNKGQEKVKVIEFEGSYSGGNPPTASFSVSPYNNTYYAGDEVEVTITLKDDLGLSYYEAYLGADRLGGRSISDKTREITYPIVLKKGANNIRVNVRDEEGQTKEYTYTITAQPKVNNKAPVVTVHGFTANYNYGQKINLELEFEDDTGLVEYSVYNGNTTVASGWPLAGKATREKISFEAKEGSTRIRITVTDKDGETTTVDKNYVGINDTTAPKADVSGIKTTYNAGEDIAFNITFSDNIALSKYDIFHNNMWVYGANLSGTYASVPVSGMIKAAGNKGTIEIRAYDTNNNEYFKICTYTVVAADNQRPTIEIKGLNPIYDIDALAGFTIVLNDNEGLSKYEIIVDGTTVKSENISGTNVTKEFAFNAKAGDHSIVINAYDTRNNLTSFPTGYRGESDSQIPPIQINGNELYYDTGAQANIELIIEDNKQLDKFEVIRGNEEKLAEGYLNGLKAVKDIVFAVVEGKNELTIKVWDKNGNLCESSIWCMGRSLDGEEETPTTPEIDDTVTGTPIMNTQSDAVSVTIPKFRIYINKKKVVNNNLKYPYIVYNDITYFPMTYHGARFLGLKSDWSAESGLKVGKLGVKSEGDNENTKIELTNDGTYTAYRTTGYILVNGKYIDNSAEQYPLLNFRDVTYFPLTWRFSVTEFGWEYSFTQASGLVINSK